MDDVLFRVIVSVVGTVISTVLILVGQYVSQRVGGEKLSKAYSVAAAAVECVEQFVTKVHGEAKAQAAIRYAKNLAARYGLNLTGDQWRILIEQAVYAMNQAREYVLPSAPETETPPA
jgi:hypothetical protein